MTPNNNQINFTKLLNLSAILFVGGILISFVSSWLVTKVLNQEYVGIYQFLLNILETGALVCTAGFQLLAVKEIPFLNYQKFKISIFIQQGLRTILLSSTLIIPAIYILHYSFSQHGDNANLPLLMALIVLPAFTILKFFSSILHGFEKIYLAVIPEKIIRPLSVVIFCLVFWIAGIYQDKTIYFLILLFGLFSFITGAIFYNYIQKNSKHLQQKAPVKNYYLGALSIFPFVLLSNLNLKIDGFILYGLESLENYAIYAQANKFAYLSAFGLVIYDHVFAPYISQNNQSLNQRQINQFIVKKIRVVFVVSILVFAAIVFLGEDILSTFGKKTDNYEKGYEAMIILGLGQLINVAFGPVINILILNQQQKVAIYSVSIALFSNIILNYLWIPTMGINGAALATSVSFIIWKSLLLYFVKTKTNFKSAIWERV